MDEELFSNVKVLIIMFVVFFIILAISVIVMINYETLKGEAEIVGASNFVINLYKNPSMTCPDGKWAIDFGPFNISDPQRRNINITPIIAFSGGQNFGFAAKSSDMDSDYYAGEMVGLFTLKSGKGSTSSLRFTADQFASNGAGAFPPTQKGEALNMQISFWIWTEAGGCITDAINHYNGFGGTSFLQLLSYASSTCPDRYIGVLYRNVTNNCTAV